jgi:hypothetical protein
MGRSELAYANTSFLDHLGENRTTYIFNKLAPLKPPQFCTTPTSLDVVIFDALVNVPIIFLAVPAVLS